MYRYVYTCIENEREREREREKEKEREKEREARHSLINEITFMFDPYVGGESIVHL